MERRANRSLSVKCSSRIGWVQSPGKHGMSARWVSMLFDGGEIGGSWSSGGDVHVSPGKNGCQA